MSTTLSPAAAPSTQLLSKAAVCARLGIAPRTLENLVRCKSMPAGVRLGRYVYWHSEAVDTWLKRAFSVQLAHSRMPQGI